MSQPMSKTIYHPNSKGFRSRGRGRKGDIQTRAKESSVINAKELDTFMRNVKIYLGNK